MKTLKLKRNCIEIIALTPMKLVSIKKLQNSIQIPPKVMQFPKQTNVKSIVIHFFIAKVIKIQFHKNAIEFFNKNSSNKFPSHPLEEQVSFPSNAIKIICLQVMQFSMQLSKTITRLSMEKFYFTIISAPI